MGRDDSGRASIADVVLVAVGLGLLIGLGEVLGLGWRYFIRDVLTHVSPHVVWMAPVGYAVLFLALVPIAIAARPLATREGRGGLAPVVFICVFLGLIGWIVMLPWSLHWVAMLVLSAGGALQLARAADRHSTRVMRTARRVVPLLATLVAVSAGVLLGRDSRLERAAHDAAGAVASGAPNVLLLVLDTVRARSLGLYGGRTIVSPNIDALSSSSIVFGNAIATAPWTLPSHGSMFTGRWPHELSAGWSDPLDDAEPTLAEVLSARGYATAGFVANLSYASRPFGLDRGFARYEDFPLTAGQTVLSMSLGRAATTLDRVRARLDRHELLNRKTAGRINRDFLDWVASRPDRPFFAFLNYFDAHEPYEPPRDIRATFAPGFRRTNIGHRHNLLRGVNSRRLLKAEMPPEDIPRELGLYEGAIQAIDIELGRLFEHLEAAGLLENTILVLTSDHGEHFGEHGIFEHGQTLYEAATRVPLLVRPIGGIEGGRRVERPVSIRDIPSTILDLALGDPSALPGSSLAQTWSDNEGERASAVVSPALSQLHRGTVEQPWYPIAAGLDMQAMMSGSLYYICNPDASEELYDLATDPDETDNLAGTPYGDQAILAFRSAVAPIGAPPRWCPPPAEQAPKRPERGR